MNTPNNHPVKRPGFQDVSRYTRWICQLDEKDRKLSFGKRKGKWALVLSILLLVFVLSFLLVPPIPLRHKRPDQSGTTGLKELSDPSNSSTYDMPVDTFEQLLKQRVHENLSERK
jgi:hypothetical protein